MKIKSRSDELIKEIDEYLERKPKGRPVYSTRPLQLKEIRAKIEELEEKLAAQK
ncbi:hypothetical protein ABE073_02740 [Lederbergia citrisecunda]|uniref:hypothetical protein n=1 Tax=Lederbergia citrisecunda TaxID=2833583 RepID=UPI003D2CF3BB